jgi:homoserine O-acetyltransferase
MQMLSAMSFAGGDYQLFDLGDFRLDSGATLPNAKLSYVTHGELNADKSNLILVPSAYLGDHHGFDFLIDKEKALDPSQYFIVATDMFQNGLSSSPSNTPPPLNGPNFPTIAIRDNVNAGYRLVTEVFGVDHIVAVIGFSMGAQQAFQWAVSYPTFMDGVVGIAGSAVEYPHGIVRLEGFKSAIKADSAYADGNYAKPPEIGLRAGGTHWASWGTSQEWFRKELYRTIGLDSPSAVIKFYQQAVLSWDANNLLGLATTWQNNDVGDTPGFEGDSERALRSIKTRVLYMPSETDMYFHIDALRQEAQFISNVQFSVIPTLWGHLAGGGVAPADAEFINNKISAFLAAKPQTN